MKKVLLIIIVLGSITVKAQNNPIFNGGIADGWDKNAYQQINNIIYTGGNGDGWNYNSFAQVENSIFNGGVADGWNFTSYLQAGNSIFNGGEGDGWNYTTYLQTGNGIFNGGEGDGWASTYRPMGPLPLMLTYFNAVKYKASAAYLTWETSLEINTAYFDVERSTDGINFIKIAKINAAANSQRPTVYSFIDYAPLAGANFYRLKMVDADAAYAYSIYRIINFNVSTKASVKFYPNPTRGKLFIEFNADMAKENKNISIFSEAGTLLQQFTNGAFAAQKLEINFNSFPKGIYFIQIKTKQELYTQRIVLQ